MAFLLLGVGILSGITAGVTSAQNYCKYEQQLKDVLQQTDQISDKSKQVLDALEQQDQSIARETQALQIAALTASNSLVELRKAYVAQLQRYQLFAMMFVVLVFMLLLAKKLKII
jgi:hypothetical protein